MSTTTTRTTSTVSAASLLAAYHQAALSVTSAIHSLRSVGHAAGQDSAFGTVLSDLERIQGLLAERAAPKAKPPVAAPTVQPMATVTVATGCQCPSCQWAGPANQFVTNGQCKACWTTNVPLPASAKPATAPTSEPVQPVVAPATVAPVLAHTSAPTAKPIATVQQQVDVARATVAAIPPAVAAPKADGLNEYRQLQAACKAAGLSGKGSKDELVARLAAPKATPKASAVLYVKVAEGKFRQATEAELLAALEAITHPAAK